MPPKAKQQPAAANGKTDSKPPKPSANATAEGSSEKAKPATPTTVTKPDTAAYHAEQDALKKEIDQAQAKLNAVKEKINFAKGGPGNEKRDALRAELDAIRGQQGSNKVSRQKLLEQIQTLQTNIANKVKALNASRGKVPYKTVEDINAQIAKLDGLVNSGTMKLVDERKTLQEISSLKRSRKTFETFQSEQDSIDKDRAELDALRAQLDDPEMKAISEKYDQIKTELDSLKQESDKAYEGRSKLFDERTQLQAQLDELHKKRRDAQAAHRAANDAYWKKVNDDRAKRAERLAAERKANEEGKRREIAERMLEEAKDPAYAAEIQDCQTLIDYFVRTSGGGGSSSGSAAEQQGLANKAEIVGVPKLELRKVDNQMEGMTAMKKKGEEENNYFVAKKTKKPAPSAAGKGKATATTAAPVASSDSSSPAQLNIPFGTLSGLMAFSIPPPANASEVPRVIEDLKMKKAWFVANQDRVTKENIAKAQAAIEKLNKAATTQPEQAEGQEDAAAAVEASA